MFKSSRYCLNSLGAHLIIKKPTIDDVAALSSVGRTTVSRVLNGGQNVRDIVRERVLAAVKTLDYKVNLQARSLASGSNKVIALIYSSNLESEPNSYYHSGLELGALRACTDSGYQLQTHAINQDSADYYDKILRIADKSRFDGLIISPPFCDDIKLLNALIEKDCPFVCISAGNIAAKSAHSIGIDEEMAGYEIAKYLLRLGHKSFGYILGLQGHISAQQRYSGYVRAIEEVGIEVKDQILERGNFTFKSGIEIAQNILTRPNPPSALIFANDDMAAGALFSAHKLGIKVPQDLSVVGFDDTPVSEIVWPPLTTVHQPLKAIGQQSVQILLKKMSGINGVEIPLQTIVPFRLQIRESTSGVQ